MHKCFTIPDIFKCIGLGGAQLYFQHLYLLTGLTKAGRMVAMLNVEKVEAEMEVRWRQDVFAILDSSPPQHAMTQCGRNTLWTPMQGDDAIMKCARQQCDVWGRTHFKKWVQMYIFKSKATAVCYSRRPKIPFCAATLFTLSPLHAPLCPSWAWQGWRRWWSDDNDWTI